MLEQVFAIGFNHSNADATQRSRLALTEERQSAFYQQARANGLHSVCILNTCNRSEVYGEGALNVAQSIFREVLAVGTEANFPLMMAKQGGAAVQHVHAVASGLDSQVIGDLEILGQFKNAFRVAKQNGALNGHLERLANSAIQAAKEIRTQTKLSSGTVSLAYAVTKYLKNNFGGLPLNVLLVGAGEFATNIALNLNKYLPNAKITICNRTASKADSLAERVGGKGVAMDRLSASIAVADVVVSSVNANGRYVIDRKIVPCDGRRRVFLDMSIPFSVDPSVTEHGGTILTTDEIGAVISETLATRESDIPLAKQVLGKHVAAFCDWYRFREHADTLKRWRHLVEGLSQTCPWISQLEETQRNRFIRKNMTDFTQFLRNQSPARYNIEQTIAHFMTECTPLISCINQGGHAAPRVGCKNCNLC